MVLNVEVEFLLKHFDFQYLESMNQSQNFNFYIRNRMCLTIGRDNFDRHFSIVCRSLSNSAVVAKSADSVVVAAAAAAGCATISG